MADVLLKRGGGYTPRLMCACMFCVCAALRGTEGACRVRIQIQIQIQRGSGAVSPFCTPPSPGPGYQT